MLFLLQILSVAPIKAQIPFHPYISPGMKLSTDFDQGLTFSAEVTIGIAFSVAHSSVAIGYQFIPEKPKSVIYFAAQGGITYFGVSRGVSLYYSNGTIGRGSRAALYFGMHLEDEYAVDPEFSIPVIIFSYEKLEFPSLATRYRYFGIWGKLLTFPNYPSEDQ